MGSVRRPIRALVVDYGEVLCHAADPLELAGMARIARVDPSRFADAYWYHREPYDRGEVDGRDYWRLVAQTTGAPVDDALAAELVRRDIALWSRIDDPMLEWARGLAGRGVRVGLLSNMVREIGAHLRDTLGLFEAFASVTYSYEVRLAKPDPAIYRHALESLAAAPGEALFVDDRTVNVEAAREVGMHVHHFRGRERLLAEIDALYAFVPNPG